MVEIDVVRNFSDYRRELAGRHMDAILIHVPQLNKHFSPRLGISSAIQSCKRPGFDLSDVIAGFDREAVVVEYQLLLSVSGEVTEQPANRDVGRVKRLRADFNVASREHLR